MTISTAGTVVDGRDITGSVTVNAPNVTIRNSRVRGNAFQLVASNSTGLVVQDSELINRPVAGQPNCHNAIGFGNYTARRVESTGCENGADMSDGNAVLQDSYIHDLDLVGPSWVFGTAGPHTDGVQLVTGGNVRIVHNNISLGGPGGTSGVIAHLAADDVRIEDNRIDGRGASYALYAPRTAKTAWHVNRNRMLRGVGGYTACVKPGNTVTEFAGNVDDGTGAAITPDNGAGGSCTN